MAARNPFASSVPDIYDPYASPYARRAPLSTGYYFFRTLLIVGGVCGALVAAYRNDVFLELARHVGQESRYLAAEQYLVGTPGWGTPRSMGPVLNPSAGTDSPSTNEPSARLAGRGVTATEPAATAATPPPAPLEARTPSPAEPPAPRAAAPVAAPAANAAAPAVAKAASDPLAPVSLDSLPVLGKGNTPARTVVETPVAHAAAPAPAARSFAPAQPATATARSIPAPHRAPPPPAPPPAPVAAKPAPPPPGPKTTDAHKNDNPLMAAVRGAVRARPPKESVPAAQ
jgi:hypothetical protein